MRWLGVTLACVATVVGAYFLGSFLSFSAPVAPSGTHGRFIGRVAATWLSDGRRMQLLDDFLFVDPSDQAWLAPQGAIVDGASIPQPLWSMIGGPFEGKYREASVVHDVACEQKLRPWREVHRMFYDACRTGGIAEQRAKLLYWAVYHYGPRWEFEQRERPLVVTGPDGVDLSQLVTETIAVSVARPSLTAEEISWAADYFANHDVDAELVPYVQPREF